MSTLIIIIKKYLRGKLMKTQESAMKPLLHSTDVFKREFSGICQTVEPQRNLCNNLTSNIGYSRETTRKILPSKYIHC